MSVLIKDMEKPKSCYAVIDGESEYCPFVNTDDDCVLLLKKGTCEGTWADQYSKCPLIEAPELCEDAVSRQQAIDALESIGSLDTEADKKYARSVFEALPSAQPEVIHCRECRHHHYESKDIPYCDRIDYGYGWKDNDFCSKGKRRTDE